MAKHKYLILLSPFPSLKMSFPIGRTISYSTNHLEKLVGFSPVGSQNAWHHGTQMRVHVSDTIDNVISRLADKLRVSPEAIVLIFMNNLLDPARTVGSYGLDNDTVQIEL